nr:PREDICTED: LOW QUALITY PROTEIN: P2Y purinoceptor 3-like [Haliaeetus albicilla]
MEGPKGTENSTSGKALCPLVESYKYILLPLTYSSVFVLGLLLHGAMLRLSWRLPRQWTCTSIYLVNRAVADLLYLFSLPLLIVNYLLQDTWPFGELLCKLVRFLFYANLYGSILLLTCISIHRFLGICHPIRSLPYRTRRLAAAGTATSWALVFLQLLPTLIYARTGVINNHTVCYDMTSPENLSGYFPYGMALTASGFLFPFLVILACYCLTIRSLTQHAGDANPAGIPSQVDPNHSPRLRAFCGLSTAVPHHPQHLPLRPCVPGSRLPTPTALEFALQDLEATGEPQQLHQPPPLLSFWSI